MRYATCMWKQLLAYTTICDIIQGPSASEMEHCFRAYRNELLEHADGKLVIHCDGKTVRGSFDHFADSPALSSPTRASWRT